MMKTKSFSTSGSFRTLLCLIFLLAAASVVFSVQGNPAEHQASKTDTAGKKLTLFGSEDILNVTLKFDLSTFLKKNLKTGSLDGEIDFILSDTDTIDRKVKIKPRGNYRFKTCGFPPIRLNFKKPVNAYPDTGKIKKIKLVTHCQQGKAYDDFVLREYLVYKLFSVLTDTSFRVRLLRIEYIDTHKERKPINQYGFLIEPLEIMAMRTNSSIVKVTHLTQKNIVPKLMDRVAIFSYMVAQWDWAVPGLHNISVIVPENYAGTGLGVAVPYDFDLTGLVNAPYGFPDEATGLKSNRDRKYTGICRSREEFVRALEEFKNLKESFYSVINDFPLLEQRSKKDITDFLDQFFNQLDNQKDMERLITQFMTSCKPL